MLSSLYIKNYALIDELSVDFNSGLTTITGETGAGKSILLGGLSLVLGKRANLSDIKNPTQKSIIECIFKLDLYDLKPFFDQNDLEYDHETIIRREVLPSGKSRAFINDSPVTLAVLSDLGLKLIDIHSQHETLFIVEEAFQFDIIDALGKTKSDIEKYIKTFHKYKFIDEEIKRLKKKKQDSVKDFDYHNFLLNELKESKILDANLQELESDYETLSNVDQIQEELSNILQFYDNDMIGFNAQFMLLKQRLRKLSQISREYEPLFERIQSIGIEMDDIYSDVEFKINNLESDPNRLGTIESKIKTIHDLFNKHNANSIGDLNEVFKNLEDKTIGLDSYEKQIRELELNLEKELNEINHLCSQITKKRKAIIPKLIDELESILSSLGMEYAQFQINIDPSETFLSNGKDVISFMLKANRGSKFLPLRNGASGGELSRIILALKYILSKHHQLPTIMFDEIDSGVSGEISNKIASLMEEMGNYMQVFTITHLPQIAARGTQHFKVYKTHDNNATTTKLKSLNSTERLDEIAQMLGGEKITASAKAHAKELLN